MKNFLNRALKETADGSHTLFLPDWNEHYHSVHGALSESLHVFIQEGFDIVARHFAAGGGGVGKSLKILEVGFGTGLNALLTMERAMMAGVRVQYLALEPYPLTAKEISELNLPDIVAGGKLADEFFRMHNAPFGEMTGVRQGFIFSKWRLRLQDAPLPPSVYHLVYHDAFAPEVQPELWGAEVFDKLYRAMAPGGVLTSYSAKGSVKRTLTDCGFSLSHPPGPSGKREMTRACS